MTLQSEKGAEPCAQNMYRPRRAHSLEFSHWAIGYRYGTGVEHQGPGEAAEVPQLSDVGFEWSTVGDIEVYNSPICIV